MRMQMGIDIEAPPELVWTYLVEPDKAMSWYTMLTTFDWTDDQRGPGATFYWEEDVRGKIYANTFRTTEWTPHRLFAFESVEGNFFESYTERWTIEPTGSGCRFSFDDDLVFPYGFFGKIMGFFGELMARRSSRQILQNIKRLAESEARAQRAMTGDAE